MITIQLDKSIPAQTRLSVKRYCTQHFPNAVVNPGEVSLGIELETLSSLSSLGSLIISMIALYVQIRRGLIDDTPHMEWTSERLEKSIRDQMLKVGAHNLELMSVDNFTALVERTSAPCKAVVRDTRTNTQYSVHVFSDGDAFTIRASERS